MKLIWQTLQLVLAFAVLFGVLWLADILLMALAHFFQSVAGD
jgi:hypothetical protein